MDLGFESLRDRHLIMKEINFLILFLFSTMLLISKSFSSTENDEFIKLEETHNIICKNVTFSNVKESKGPVAQLVRAVHS